MLGILLAGAASVGYGVSDFYAGVVARRMPSVLIALWSQVVGVAGIGLGVAVSGQAFAGAGFAWGIGAGVVAAIAILLFYRALETGPASIAAPLAAAGTLVPVAVSLARGDGLPALALAGVPVTVVGLALVVRGDAGEDRPEGAGMGAGVISLSLLSAVGFGSFFVLLDAGTSAAPGAELWTILGVLVAALPTTLAAAVRAGVGLRPSRALLPIAPVALFDLGADFSLTLALTHGDLATVSVLASLDPLVTVLLALVLLRERLPRLQLAGVALCLAGVVMVATA